MEQPAGGDVTQLLLAWGQGEETALDKLTTLVYQELHRIAQRYMGGQRPGHTLQTTALVNEAYLKLVDYDRVQWRDRAHFFAVSAQVMRRILVDSARARNTQKRGGKAQELTLDEALVMSKPPGQELLDLDEALKNLAAFDPRKERVVELRFFGGLTVKETAEVLKVSPDTVMRDWRLAKMWLLRELEGDQGGSRTLEED
jgi:RNA polymerase sigma factor (TIGR02999 family)